MTLKSSKHINIENQQLAKHLTIHAITEKGDGHVTKWLSIPLTELEGAELPVHLNMFNQDVVLELGITEGAE